MRKFQLVLFFALLLVYTYTRAGSEDFRNVLAVFEKKCIRCHYQDGPAPFDFTNPQIIKDNAATIKHVVSLYIMPKWLADTDYSHFWGENKLTHEEVALIVNWVNSGARLSVNTQKIKRAGNTNFIFDTILTLNNAYTLIGVNRDSFILSNYNFEFRDDTLLRGISYIIKNKRYLHHSTLYSVSNAPLLNDNRGFNDQRTVIGGYLPGMNAFGLPDGFGWKVKRQTTISIENHFSPVTSQEEVSIDLGLKYAGSNNRPVYSLNILYRDSVNLVPADTVITFKGMYKVRDTISMLCITPHMHYRGKNYKSFFVTPLGDTVPVIRIKDWDFNWQGPYRMTAITVIPAGSTFFYEATFDNTSLNFRNPVIPPVAVSLNTGWMSKDEMLNTVIQYAAYKAGDEKIQLSWE